MPSLPRAPRELDILREFRGALESGDMESVVQRHGNAALFRYLQHRQSPLFQVQRMLWPFINQNASTPNAEKAWKVIGRAVSDFPLPLLLDTLSLDISRLSYSIRVGIIKQLTYATQNELESLTLSQRQVLVYFTLKQLAPMLTKAPHAEALQRQAATLGYLALAMLKQPGAERPDIRGLQTNHANLRKAINDYVDALKPHG